MVGVLPGVPSELWQRAPFAHPNGRKRWWPYRLIIALSHSRFLVTFR